ncbi:MAG: alpha/beta hydrolase [Clostridia bacterium]|nr:alpha/beta hydrolase [Clostridia bacterium]
MDPLLIVLICVVALAAVVSVVSYVCFYLCFYSKPRVERDPEDIGIPPGEEYEPYRSLIADWVHEVDALDCRKVSVKTFDGITLNGRYFEFKKGAPIELMLHGYKGSSRRDLSGGVIRCRELGHNVLIFDHRGGETSGGSVITFGINESRDTMLWIDYILKNIDPDARIILTGVSMGAATVMMVAAEELPRNIVGVLADCGYTSAKEIIKKVIREMKLPADLLYPFVKLGALLYGGFRLEENSPIEAMKKCTLPIIFFHGDNDGFVPCEMSRKNYDACASEKKHLVYIEGAGHGLAFPADPEKYLREMREFFAYIHK